ncbi:HIT domain-containing protein, partial [uncultured Fusobacterium sp.]|uniref:HIT family protein n=1 Tax=uncultured Fusobacterium sp. TaxID=159267 RepID=UPI00345879F2
MKFAPKISLHFKERLGATGINILHASGKSAQQSVPHFHIHIFPRFDDDGLDTWCIKEAVNGTTLIDNCEDS